MKKGTEGIKSFLGTNDLKGTEGIKSFMAKTT